ncbi:hypothetical protein [Thermus sp.]|uniref:hypothetical protein n=1 Tax=Thermus sp. TaxID=275 RepID=UPI003D1414BF
MKRDLSRSRSALMRALKRAEQALNSKDDATAIRAAHAIATVVGSVVKLVEVSELQARVEELEARVAELAGTKMRSRRTA